ncbi:hypothetical protein GGI19_001912 [Coemansia pectinata]|uniref:Uncharacterized protein n=1 Tax=Coemansia pectinata TaxID=1052879 RepID=A0A9W8LD12_9FUNG|nr:hypothetical protein GGI19_001912 [Coemansia pectinata]
MKEYIIIAFLGAAILTGTLDVRDIIGLFLGVLLKDLLDRMYPTTQHTGFVHTARRHTSKATNRPALVTYNVGTSMDTDSPAPVTYNVGTQVYGPSPPRVVDQGVQADEPQTATSSAGVQTGAPVLVAISVAVQVDEPRVAASSACVQTDLPVYDEESEYDSDDQSDDTSSNSSSDESDDTSSDESESDDKAASVSERTASSTSDADTKNTSTSTQASTPASSSGSLVSSTVTVSRKLPSSAAPTLAPTTDNKSAVTVSQTSMPASSSKNAASSASTANRQSPATGTLKANYAMSTSGSKDGIQVSTFGTGVLNPGVPLDTVGTTHAGAQDDDIMMSTADTDPHDCDVVIDAKDTVARDDDNLMGTAYIDP